MSASTQVEIFQNKHLKEELQDIDVHLKRSRDASINHLLEVCERAVKYFAEPSRRAAAQPPELFSLGKSSRRTANALITPVCFVTPFPLPYLAGLPSNPVDMIGASNVHVGYEEADPAAGQLELAALVFPADTTAPVANGFKFRVVSAGVVPRIFSTGPMSGQLSVSARVQMEGWTNAVITGGGLTPTGSAGMQCTVRISAMIFPGGTFVENDVTPLFCRVLAPNTGYAIGLQKSSSDNVITLSTPVQNDQTIVLSVSVDMLVSLSTDSNILLSADISRQPTFLGGGQITVSSISAGVC